MGKRGDIEAGDNVKNPEQSPPRFVPSPVPEPWTPWLVPLIFAVDITLFVYTMYVNDCPATTGADSCILYHPLGRFSFQPLSENSVLGPSIGTLEHLGALDPTLIFQGKEAWRLISCIWLHAGVAHLFANMMSLLFIGLRLEQEFGFLRIGLLYLCSGFGGSLMSALSYRPMISVGASGALLGLLGAMLSELITNWTIYTNKCSAILTLVVIITINLALSFIPQVDYSAHIGGFLSGFLLGFVLLMRPQYGYVSQKYVPAGYDIKNRTSKYKWYQHILWILGLIILIYGYLWGLTLLFASDKVASMPPTINH